MTIRLTRFGATSPVSAYTAEAHILHLLPQNLHFTAPHNVFAHREQPRPFYWLPLCLYASPICRCRMPIDGANSALTK